MLAQGIHVLMKSDDQWLALKILSKTMWRPIGMNYLNWTSKRFTGGIQLKFN
jgi:hypothetical protein